jgi:hypothetical protein
MVGEIRGMAPIPPIPPIPPLAPLAPLAPRALLAPYAAGLGDLELATLTSQLGHYFGTEKGVLVVRGPEGGTLNLKDGDVILSVDGREATSASHVTRILASYMPGEKVTLHIVRERKTLDLQSTVPDRPAFRGDRFFYFSPQGGGSRDEQGPAGPGPRGPGGPGGPGAAPGSGPDAAPGPGSRRGGPPSPPSQAL